MGMYDHIDYECVCPACHGKVKNFQSKDADRQLDLLQPNEVDNFYSDCSKCHLWVEFNKVKEGRFTRTVVKFKNGKDIILEEHTKVIKIKSKPIIGYSEHKLNKIWEESYMAPKPWGEEVRMCLEEIRRLNRLIAREEANEN